ncbi:hypothetical protein [Holospora curviuscula]|uniref:Uncharacterized protein n=1 Tax=Holospora curviuscula TaxID=1082868 RepID=A0A2S5RA87_9PROT|nr:hypothetical protein [Holospora curviuscula]PPE04213.1 hypothetical protein HCUR_00404 [Holospora curviuscula]
MPLSQKFLVLSRTGGTSDAVYTDSTGSSDRLDALVWEITCAFFSHTQNIQRPQVWMI